MTVPDDQPMNATTKLQYNECNGVFQGTVPKKMAERLGWEKGDELWWHHDPEEDAVRIAVPKSAEN